MGPNVNKEEMEAGFRSKMTEANAEKINIKKASFFEQRGHLYETLDKKPEKSRVHKKEMAVAKAAP